MKKLVGFSIVSGLFLLSGLWLIFPLDSPVDSLQKQIHPPAKKEVPHNLLLPMLTELQWMKLRNPKTGRIPADIRSRELAFSSGLPMKSESVNQLWNPRGPNNIGGRMLCIAIDIENENHILAGSASGGMWQSLDGGGSWQKTTAPDAEQSATCIVQDCRPDKHNIWYYGSGELLSTTNRNVSTNVRTVGIGNGIFKSIDHGQTWQPLASTQGGSPGVLEEVFQGIWRIVTDPVTMDKDIVYAACYGAIMRSDNGGADWQMVLGDLQNKSYCSDVAITTDGVLYVALSSYGWSIEPPSKAGIWRSADGFSWEKITPPGFPTDNRVTRVAIAPSDENILYVFTESQSPDLNPFNGYTNSVNTFWKMTWEPVSDTAIWENRTMGIPGAGNGSINSFPFSFVVYGGYCFTMGVKPDDEEVVFLGGMNLYRSDNGFADSLHTTFAGGYPFDMDSLHALHPDQHGITFLPSDPNVLFMSNDGGIYVTYECMADSSSMYWDRLNNQLTTTQFYSVAIDHGAAGDDWILGGLQDNNWYYTVTDDPSAFWFDIDICYDGFATCVSPGWEYCVISAYSGNIWTSQFDDDMHTKNIFPQLPDTLLKYYDPVMGSNSLFPFYQNFVLDPVTHETFYLPTITSVWRKDNLKAASYDTGLRNTGWSHLSNINVGDASEISFITVSTLPPNRLYYGTNLGRVYRLDNANTGNPDPSEITGSEFPLNAFVACIDVDPDNANYVMVAFSNYEVPSLFYTTNGGADWITVGGNLEEFPDGSGSGPSVRWVKKLFYEGRKVFFAGTSTGLYSTSELTGDSTVWILEGDTTIGHVIIDMIDARQTDGFIAVATHGNGVYSTYYNPSAGINEFDSHSDLMIGDLYPNPARNMVNAEVTTTADQLLDVSCYPITGRLDKSLYLGQITLGKNFIVLNINGLSSGIWMIRFRTSTADIIKKIVVVN